MDKIYTERDLRIDLEIEASINNFYDLKKKRLPDNNRADEAPESSEQPHSLERKITNE